MILRQADGSYILTFPTAKLSAIQIDFTVTLSIRDQLTEVNIRIGEPFVVEGPNGSATATPGVVETLACVLPLWNGTATHVVIANNGELTLPFEDGRRVVVPPNENLEAWEIGARDPEQSLLIVCAPGGEVAIFERPAGRA
jgi:hypothetical protein